MPTNRDLLKAVLAEVTGEPETVIETVLEGYVLTFGAGKLNDEISAQEYDTRFAELIAERAGILNWISAGRGKR